MRAVPEKSSRARAAALALACTSVYAPTLATAQATRHACPDDTEAIDLTEIHPRMDDGGYEVEAPTSVFPDGIPFGGGRWPSVWINVDGSISLERELGAPSVEGPLEQLEQPVVAPFLADADLRDQTGEENPGRVVVCADQDRPRWWVSWIDVPPYGGWPFHSRTNTFQVGLRPLQIRCPSRDDPQVEALEVEFRYVQLSWDVGSASGGHEGRCASSSGCTYPLAGLHLGPGGPTRALPGSGTAEARTTLPQQTNADGAGVFRFLVTPDAISACGDAVVQGCEQCDDRGPTSRCDPDCTWAECGDSTLNEMAGEQCDEGSRSPTCDADCTPVECGDGLINPAAGERCDDANLLDGDGCSSTCTQEVPPGPRDAGSRDAGASADGGHDDPAAHHEFGCGCSVAGNSTPTVALGGLLALCGLRSRMRRRRRRSAR